MFKKILLLVGVVLVIGLVVLGLVKGNSPDYTTSEFEQALINGDDVEGKTVAVEVLTLIPDSAFGYNIQAGEHLNFVSAANPKVKEGDTIVLKVERVASMFGSFVITYTK